MGGQLGIELFLSRLKDLLAQRKVQFKPRNRNKTMSFLLQNDLDANDAFEMIEQLEEKHFYRGPEADRNGTEGNIMVFLCPYEHIKLYIKVKIWTEQSTGERAVVLSFHEEGMHDA